MSVKLESTEILEMYKDEKNSKDEMQKLYTISEMKSGYCWTNRHKKCENITCPCFCHSKQIRRKE